MKILLGTISSTVLKEYCDENIAMTKKKNNNSLRFYMLPPHPYCTAMLCGEQSHTKKNMHGKQSRCQSKGLKEKWENIKTY